VLVLEVVGVGDLARCPRALVGRVVDLRRVPLALVVGVGLERTLPFAAARSLLALRVGNRRGNPVAILLVIPLLGLDGLRVGDGRGLVLEPAFGPGGLGVLDLIRRILVPLSRLGSLRVSDLGLINPVLGLGVLGVI